MRRLVPSSVAATAGLLLSVVLCACGSQAAPPLNATAAAGLHRDVARIRAATAAHDAIAARDDTLALERRVSALVAAGQLSLADGAVLEADARRLASAVAAQQSTTTATATVASTTTTVAPPTVTTVVTTSVLPTVTQPAAPAVPPGQAKKHGQDHAPGPGNGGDNGHGHGHGPPKGPDHGGD